MSKYAIKSFFLLLASPILISVAVFPVIASRVVSEVYLPILDTSIAEFYAERICRPYLSIVHCPVDDL